MANRIRPLVQAAGLERIKRKAYKKFGVIVGKKAATWLAGAVIGGAAGAPAAGAPAAGVGAAPGAAVGLVISTAINIVGGAADVLEICKCAWKCK